MYENRQIDNYIYETRFIASWLNAGGELRYLDDVRKFYKWLLTLGLNEDEAKHIKFLATNGKLELEVNAKEFLKEHKD